MLAACLLFAAPLNGWAQYTSGNPDVLSANTGLWNASGVTLGGTIFINLGLEGVGRIPASALDPGTGESLGSISSMQLTTFVNNGNGSYTGSFSFLPDRGYNSGSTFSNYAARINQYDFTFTPYTAAASTTNQNQIQLTFAGSTRFTYGAASTLTTGLPANGSTTQFGGVLPASSGTTTLAGAPVTNRLTVDAEALVFDTRPGKSGSGWVGDEYGANIYHFNASKQIDGVLGVPAALVPHSPAGTTNFNADPAADGLGRRPRTKQTMRVRTKQDLQD